MSDFTSGSTIQGSSTPGVTSQPVFPTNGPTSIYENPHYADQQNFNQVDCPEGVCEEHDSDDESEDESKSTGHWMTPFSFIRSLVSKDKRRFKDGKYDLDLSYITPRIIAMGYPSSNMEGLYRNKLSDVVSFLNTRHPHHYKVYNLCIETSRHYDNAYFENRVAMYPFVDHNAPTLDQILSCCRDIHDWLNQDPENIVAVHCKAGKGRTGVMISCYLYYSHQFATIDEALNFYAAKRTYNNKGVTIPSQLRFVHYFGELVSLWNCIEQIKLNFNKKGHVEDHEITSLKGSSYHEYPMTLSQDYIRSKLQSIYHGPLYVLDTDVIPFNSMRYITSFKVSFGSKTRSNFNMLKVKINSRNGKYFYNSKNFSEDRVMNSDHTWSVSFDDVLVEDEVLIQLFNGHQNILLQFWFHCAFIHDNYLHIDKMDLDLINKDKKHKEFDKYLFVETTFRSYISS